MQFDVPTVINEMPTKSYWKGVYPDEGYKASLAYKTAVKVYWKTVLSESQNHKCCWCGIRMIDEPGHKKSSTIEHVVPRSEGGLNHPDNYAVACNRCNQERGTQDAELYLEKVQLRMSLQSIGVRYNGARRRGQNQKGTRSAADITSEKNSVQSRKAVINALLIHNVRFNSNVKASRLRRKLDAVLAAIAVESGQSNPFEIGSRLWKTFERYSSERATNNSFLNKIAA